MFYRAESGITEKASRETGALTFFPEGRTYSPPQAMVSALAVCVHACGSRALYEVMWRHEEPIFYNRYTRKEVIAYRHIPS